MLLTVDDPSNNTPIILDTLRKYGVKATFFVVHKSNVDSIYKRIINEGHVLGNHTYSHNYTNLYSSNVTLFKDDVLKMHNFLLDKFNYKSKVFRFPGGSGGRPSNILDPRVSYLKSLGYSYYNWSISTADSDPNLSISKYGSEEKIIAKLTSNIVENANNRNSLIILMHDSEDKIYTPKALPGIIEGLKSQGYSFGVLRN